MKRSQVISLIDNAISNRKGEVINALQESGVVAPIGISDEDYRNIIIREIENGNGYLVVYLGSVIDKDIQLNSEKKSNFFIAPAVGAALIGTGGSLLGGLFGGGGDDRAAQQAAQAQAAAQAAQQAAMQKQMAIAASQQAANEMLSQTNRENQRARTQRTVITLSIIGGTLLIGTIAAILIVKKK